MIRFGTDGIRGVAGQTPITAEVALQIGRAAARFGGAVAVARDTRPSGAALAAAVLAGAASAGAEALDLGVLPTSGLSAALAAGVGEVGVMITASHNPAADNGFKVLGRGGHKLSEEESARFEGWLADARPMSGWGAVRDAREEGLRAYQEALTRALPDLSWILGPVVLDLAGGALTRLVPWLRGLPLELHLVGADAVINDGVGSEHLGHVGAAVRARGAAGGLAVDGDGDRGRVVDAEGVAVEGDAIAYLLAARAGAKAIAVTVMSSAALDRALPGVRVERTPVGDKHLLDALDADEELSFGAEESGHVVFRDALPTGDGLVTGLRALAAAGAAGIRAATSGFVPFPRGLRKVVVGARPALEEVAALQAASARWQEKLPGGRVFLRYSGTEPVLRVLVEGPEAAEVRAALDELCAIAEEVLR